ncbi:MAG: cytochrome c3 family protein [Humidesulfovibrio sp.]|uniref:acidic tetraheme cytochrome c3 TmcA n=1 Tax=Humidesulfovibrio sp. TaxID=2910988 RepID=UPI0027E98A93|nr:cytochrome c3 family protein [Humidesulfovibrio sp.]MDQ7834636.1 cytochrome c3 family protein [Humidesulfovibrio sp.]
MKRTLPLLILAALTIVSALATVQAVMAQDAITKLAPEAFGTLTRPPAVFVHDKHNEKAKLEECVVCHHGGSDGKIDKSASTEGTPCVECHKVKPAGKATNLKRAYHKQCIDCHRAKGKGPLACGQCHKR